MFKGSISSTHSFVSAVASLLDEHRTEVAVFAKHAALLLATVAELDLLADLHRVDAPQPDAKVVLAERLAEELEALVSDGGQLRLGDGIVQRVRRGDAVEHVVG